MVDCTGLRSLHSFLEVLYLRQRATEGGRPGTEGRQLSLPPMDCLTPLTIDVGGLGLLLLLDLLLLLLLGHVLLGHALLRDGTSPLMREKVLLLRQ